MFQNPEIDVAALPSTAAVEWQPLDRNYLRQRLVAAVLGVAGNVALLAFLHVVLTYAFRDEGVELRLGWIWLFVPAIGIPMLIWPLLSYPRMGYSVRDRDILYKSGVLFRSVTAIPYNRIQHVEKDSTPLDRRFRLANLKIFTAGGTGGDLKISGLAADTAERLRGFILDKAGAVVERH